MNMCQADDGVTGEAVSANASSIERGAEAKSDADIAREIVNSWWHGDADLTKLPDAIAAAITKAKIAGFREGSDIKVWINEQLVSERIFAAMSNAKARGAKIKAGSTTEDAIRSAFTEMLRDAQLWEKDEAASLADHIATLHSNPAIAEGARQVAAALRSKNATSSQRQTEEAAGR